MKKKFKFCHRIHQPDFYNDKIREDWIIKKKGWFGWKYLNVYYGNFGGTDYYWSYLDKPSACNDATFESKWDCMLFLRTYYKKIKICEKCT